VLIDRGYYLLGVMIFTFVVAAPALMLVAMVSLFAGLLMQVESRAWFWITRCFCLMKDWNMTEVYLAGLFVTLIKLASLVKVELQLAFWSLLLFGFLFLAAMNSIDRIQIWLQVKRLSQR
jgi:paraquat-inducible protein A